MRNVLIATSVVALAVGQLAADRAAAQDDAEPQNSSEQLGEGDIRTLDNWSYEPLYADGMSVDTILDDYEVRGANGDDIGSVENMIFDADAKVLAIIAQVRGFWDIGDTHVSVPWNEVEVSDGALTAPVTEDNLDDYSIFGDSGFFHDEAASEVAQVDDDLETGAGVFKATDLIGDYAYLAGNERYGYVYDLLIQDGEVTTVVVEARAAGTPGYFAYPYSSYGWGRGMRDWRYDMPYAAEDVTVIDTFDYGKMRRGGMGGSAQEDS
jgi:sporulation protein YlmC with PRC-barrel domain